MTVRPIARHKWDVPLTESTETLYKVWRWVCRNFCILIPILQTVYAQEMLIGATLFFSKSSLLLLFYRIFSPDKWFRYKLYGAFVFIALTTLTSIPMYLAICLPGKGGSWSAAATKCGKTLVYSYVHGPTAVVFDLFLIYLPASIIVYLHMPLRRKIGILAIFMTGML